MTLLLHTRAELEHILGQQRSTGKSIGFVPTMGALHAGHIQLVERALRENDYAVVSIFVNPIQFNNPDDLHKYPRTLDQDMAMLQAVGCHCVFAPSVAEMYPEPDNSEFGFGALAEVMEGKFRPGHFRGVAVVVRKLFQIVKPQRAYFGEKDFQQLAIIRRLVELEKMDVTIVGCPIVRETDGLAMSSRNMRLSPDDRAKAPAIFNALSEARDVYRWFTPEGINELVAAQINQCPGFETEYVQVVDSRTLQPFYDWADVEHAVVCVAAFLGGVRLIDNIQLF